MNDNSDQLESRSPQEVSAQNVDTARQLEKTSPEAGAVVNRWRARGNTDDPYRYQDRGAVYQWRVNNASPDGVTGQVFRVWPTPGTPTHWRIQPNGRIERGTPWLRTMGVATGTAGTTPTTALHEPDMIAGGRTVLFPARRWGISTPVAIVALGDLSLGEVEELAHRARLFFGTEEHFASDAALARELGVSMAFTMRSTHVPSPADALPASPLPDEPSSSEGDEETSTGEDTPSRLEPTPRFDVIRRRRKSPKL